MVRPECLLLLQGRRSGELDCKFYLNFIQRTVGVTVREGGMCCSKAQAAGRMAMTYGFHDTPVHLLCTVRTLSIH